MTERLVWIDWLKIIVVFAVFVYHTAEPFLVINWLVSNDERSVVLSALAGFGFLFGIPLLFLLAGATAWLSLGQRSLRAYGIVRVQRLLMPLVAGILAPHPAAVVAGGRHRAGRREPAEHDQPGSSAGCGSSRRRAGSAITACTCGSSPSCWPTRILCLPLLGALRRPVGRAPAAAGWPGSRRRALLLLLFAPILASQWLLRIPTPDYRDWADFALWLGFFVVGVILLADRRLLNAVVDSGPRLIVHRRRPLVGLGRGRCRGWR